MDTSPLRKRAPSTALFDAKIVVPAISSAFVKLNPRAADEQPGHVRARNRHHGDDGDSDP
jgi:hypothetical protein